ncbi:hypothetical protein PEC18_19480 [Paucibacter sp. O1-1]|nr:hypothetical protein [Paucibacter sp. O1-1]MDA3827965.1 hypothetical protein [Paucibacter sp. O1-1]
MAAPLAAPGFAWPSLPGAGLPGPTPLKAEAEPCEIEGPSGTVSAGLLLGLDAAAGLVLIKRKQSRTPVSLKLTRISPPDPDAPAVAVAASRRRRL